MNLLNSAQKVLKALRLKIRFCNAAWKLTFPKLEYYSALSSGRNVSVSRSHVISEVLISLAILKDS